MSFPWFTTTQKEVGQSEMERLTFHTKFWDDELGNFQSYDALVKKIKEDQKSSREYFEFLKQRILAEEAHGKALAKLSKISCNKNDVGILNGAWKNCNLLCADLETLISASVSKLMAELEHSQELLLKQFEQRKKEEEEVREVQNALKSAISKLQTKQKHHQSKSKELEKARLTLRELLKDTSAKEAAKAANVLQRAEQQWESACVALNAAETQLEETRETWEFKTEQALQALQALQEQRLNALANLQELFVDTVREQTKLGLTALDRWARFDEGDVENEICSFIQRHGNCNQRPAVISLSTFDSTDTSIAVLNANPRSQSLENSQESTPGMMTLQKIKKILPSTSAVMRKPLAEPRQSRETPSQDDKVEYTSLQWKNGGQTQGASTFYTSCPSKPARANKEIPSPKEEEVVYAEVVKGPSNSKEKEGFSYSEIAKKVLKKTKAALPNMEEPLYAMAQKGTKKKAKDEGDYSFGAGEASGGNQDDSDIDDFDDEPVQGAFSSGSTLMRVIYDYSAKHPTDISLHEGDLVKLIQVVSNEWVEVRAHNGTIGHFPKNYLEPADS